MTKLPKVPSALMELALQDLRTCINKGYEVNMSDWYTESQGQCSVCLAGAVMAETIKCAVNTVPGELTVRKYRKLLALDYFRKGWIEEGLYEMDIAIPVGCPSAVNVTPYSQDVDKFFKSMEAIIRILKEHDL